MSRVCILWDEPGREGVSVCGVRLGRGHVPIRGTLQRQMLYTWGELGSGGQTAVSRQSRALAHRVFLPLAPASCSCARTPA